MSVPNPLLHSTGTISFQQPATTLSHFFVLLETPQTADITAGSSHPTTSTHDASHHDDEVELICLPPRSPTHVPSKVVGYTDLDTSHSNPTPGGLEVNPPGSDASWAFHMFLGDAKGVRDLYWDPVLDTVRGGGADRRITALAIADIALRGVGEVVFIDNTWSSMIMLVCLLIQDWYSAVMVSLFLLLLSVYTVLSPVFPRAPVCKSLYLYNTVLVTIAMTIFAHQSGNSDPITGINFLSICVGNGICFLLVCYFRMSEGLAPFCATFPFNIASIVFLIAGNGVAFSTLNFNGSVIRVDPLSMIGSNAVTSATNLTHVEAIALAIPNGFGQVFFVDIWPLGLIMLLSCGLHSPMLMVYASLGSLSGALFAWAFDAKITAIATGLWGFNPVLLAMLVGLTWTNGSQQRWVECNVEKVVVAVFLSLLTVLFTSLERFLFTSKLGVSAFTMPFCTVGVLYITVLTSPIVAPRIISA
jgi:urea transporter